MALGSSNIKISDVKSILGESNNTLSGLCTSNKINKWSKWKPLLSNVPLTNTIVNTSSCGLTYGKFANFAECALAILNGTAMSIHTYNKPTSNYRLGDFRNYEHNTYRGLLPINCYIEGNELKAYSTEPFSKLFTEYSNSSDSTKNLMNGNLYITAIMWKLDNPTIGLTRASNTILNLSSGILGLPLAISSIPDSIIKDNPGTYHFSLILHTTSSPNLRYKTFSAFPGDSSNNIIALSNDYGTAVLKKKNDGSNVNESFIFLKTPNIIIRSSSFQTALLQQLILSYICTYSNYNTVPTLTYKLFKNQELKKSGSLEVNNGEELSIEIIKENDDNHIAFNSVSDTIKLYIYLNGSEIDCINIYNSLVD